MHRDRHTQCPVAWQQAQLSLSRGGLGLRSLSEHSSAAYISSLSASGVCSSSCKHLAESIKDFNEFVSSDDALVSDHLDVVMHQRSLSGKIDDHYLSVNYLIRSPCLTKHVCFPFLCHMQLLGSL